MKFSHQMSQDGWYRIVELESGATGQWALYESPAFLELGDSKYSVFTGYYGGSPGFYPQKELVYALTPIETSHAEVVREPGVRKKDS